MTKEKMKYVFHTMVHPIDGFYEIRHHGKGSVGLALLTVFLCGAAYSLNRRYASFVVSSVNTREVNSLVDMMAVFALFFLFCIGNWSITCLMNGEGRMQDIITATGYALSPIPLIYIPATILSTFVAANEQVFYTLFIYIAVIWAFLLLISGNMGIHNFSLTKEVGTIILTIAAMIIILFIILLFYSLFQQICQFIKSIYTELIFRL